MAASLKGKRTPITTPPYQVPSVDITPDPPIFSLVTTFNAQDSTLSLFYFSQPVRNSTHPAKTEMYQHKHLTTDDQSYFNLPP